MAKRAIRLCKSHHASHASMLSRIEGDLKEKCVCYVLITCSVPASNGNMEVEMSFEGDEDLASFLVEGAAQAFNAQHVQRESQ